MPTVSISDEAMAALKDLHERHPYDPSKKEIASVAILEHHENQLDDGGG